MHVRGEPGATLTAAALAGAARAPGVVALLDGADTVFELVGDGSRWRVRIADGRIESTDGPAAFALRAADAVWSRLVARGPAPGDQSVVHLVRTGEIELIGDERAYARHIQLVRALVDAVRDADAAVPTAPSRPLDAVGRYHRTTTSLGVSDVFVERCGSGPQLLALATAGSDTSQWHGVMTESDLTDRFELVTVDLPWHGRSSPAFGAAPGSYRLSPAAYTEFIVAVADAAGLDRPVLVGASMAGAAVVHAVATHPDRFAGAVACQAGPRVRNRAAGELRATDVDQTVFVPEWTYGLMNPSSPEAFRSRVWWGYSSGGYGLYAADIASYLRWEVDDVAHLLTPDSPHIAILSGRFDTTVPPSASRELAARIPNASFEEMPELGHFPHAENPAVFTRYLASALARIAPSPTAPPDAAPTRR